MTVDPTKIKPIHIQKTILLLNNFIVTTSSFLNNFSDSCEKKVSYVSSRVTELEILLAVLEAKLNSIPDIDTPATSSGQTSTSANTNSTPSSTSTNLPPPPPSSSSSSQPPPPALSASTELVVSEVALVAEGTITAKDHPDYQAYFKMLKVGVPMPVVGNKCAAAGFDPSILENPDICIPL